MNRDLLLALLSLDSYNRGYGQNVLLNPSDSTTGQNELGHRIGSARIVRQYITDQAQNAGFYALAYDVSGAGIDGLDGTVISYRGMDEFA